MTGLTGFYPGLIAGGPGGYDYGGENWVCFVISHFPDWMETAAEKSTDVRRRVTESSGLEFDLVNLRNEPSLGKTAF